MLKLGLSYVEAVRSEASRLGMDWMTFCDGSVSDIMFDERFGIGGANQLRKLG